MATIEQPGEIVRLKKENKWNRLLTYGFKWHLYGWTSGKTQRKKEATDCGILFGSKMELEKGKFENAKVKDLCARCFSGLVITDEKTTRQF